MQCYSTISLTKSLLGVIHLLLQESIHYIKCEI